MDDQTLEERLVDLEVRISFQDATIEALSSVINQQQAQITELTTKLEQLQELVLNPGGVDPTAVKPPHY